MWDNSIVCLDNCGWLQMFQYGGTYLSTLAYRIIVQEGIKRVGWTFLFFLLGENCVQDGFFHIYVGLKNVQARKNKKKPISFAARLFGTSEYLQTLTEGPGVGGWG